MSTKPGSRRCSLSHNELTSIFDLRSLPPVFFRFKSLRKSFRSSIRNGDLSVDSDHLANRAESPALEQVGQPRFDSGDQRRTLVDKAGVKLDHRGAGADMQPRIFGARDSADADNRNFSTGVRIDVVDQLARANLERLSAESAGVRRRDSDRVSGNRTVACDDSIQLQ